MNKALENLTDEELMAYETDESFLSEPTDTDAIAEIAEEGEEQVTPQQTTSHENVSENAEEFDDDQYTDEQIANTDSYESEQNAFESDGSSDDLEEDSDEELDEDITELADAEDAESQVDEKAEEETESIDYKAAYEKIMAPFKANGKEFKPESPEEVIRLAQQGANYLKKMSALKPNLRMMRMLENNGLLDEQKLSFLIDLNAGNQEAVKKFLKDKSIDPLDINVDEEPQYNPGNYQVTDQELAFSDILQDVMSNEGGPQTVQLIQNQWDDRSKEAIYQDPSILPLIHEHRKNGIYDRIYAEMDRRKILGVLTDATPFLEAYRNIGDELHAAGKLVVQAQATAPVQNTQTRRPIASRPGHSRSAPVSNAAAARAASPARTSPKQTRPEFDPLSMTDEEIMAMSSPPM